jgi:hypothetical protein
MRRGWRIAARAATVLVAGLLTLTGAQLALAAAAPPEGAAGAAVPALVPAPVSLRAVPGEAFRLTARGPWRTTWRASCGARPASACR